MNLPFTRDQWFDVLAADNQALWPFAVALGIDALAAAVILGRRLGPS